MLTLDERIPGRFSLGPPEERPTGGQGKVTEAVSGIDSKAILGEKTRKAVPYMGLKRVPFKRKRIKKEPVSPGVFWLVLPSGDRWLWPVNQLTEAEWEGTLQDWAFKLNPKKWKRSWHCTSAQRSEPGFFDRLWLGVGQHLATEQKVRYADGTANTTSTAQDNYIYDGILAGLDVRVWTFPDSVRDAWETLTDQPWENCPYYTRPGRERQG